MSRNLMATGAVAAFVAVALGAFGAHALRDRITPDLIAVYQTGVEYHMVHALAILLVAVSGIRNARAVGWLFLGGIVVFSGSLYALALTGTRSFGAITPIGGLAFLTGWALLAVGALSNKAE